VEYKFLGSTGVQVSALCFGAMLFGGDADEATSEAMFRRCPEIGLPAIPP
jgi:aryl-alcohol dehydrogenase-like predicted oxidoreductase